MLPHVALKTHLRNDPGVAKYAGQEVYYGKSTSTSKCYIVFYLISDPPENRRLGIPSPRYQFSCFADSPEKAHALGLAVFKALDGFMGIMGGAGGLSVKQTIYMGGLVDYQDTSSGLFYCYVDFKLTFKE
jgi:hypothetical protein